MQREPGSAKAKAKCKGQNVEMWDGDGDSDLVPMRNASLWADGCFSLCRCVGKLTADRGSRHRGEAGEWIEAGSGCDAVVCLLLTQDKKRSWWEEGRSWEGNEGRAKEQQP